MNHEAEAMAQQVFDYVESKFLQDAEPKKQAATLAIVTRFAPHKTEAFQKEVIRVVCENIDAAYPPPVFRDDKKPPIRREIKGTAV